MLKKCFKHCRLLKVCACVAFLFFINFNNVCVAAQNPQGEAHRRLMGELKEKLGDKTLENAILAHRKRAQQKHLSHQAQSQPQREARKSRPRDNQAKNTGAESARESVMVTSNQEDVYLSSLIVACAITTGAVCAYYLFEKYVSWKVNKDYEKSNKLARKEKQKALIKGKEALNSAQEKIGRIGKERAQERISSVVSMDQQMQGLIEKVRRTNSVAQKQRGIQSMAELEDKLSKAVDFQKDEKDLSSQLRALGDNEINLLYAFHDPVYIVKVGDFFAWLRSRKATGVEIETVPEDVEIKAMLPEIKKEQELVKKKLTEIQWVHHQNRPFLTAQENKLMDYKYIRQDLLKSLVEADNNSGARIGTVGLKNETKEGNPKKKTPSYGEYFLSRFFSQCSF